MLEKYFPKSECEKNVLTLITGTSLSQLIPFLVLPVLQRYFYTPADFGVFTLFVSFSSVIIAMASLKYELAIVITESLEDAVNLEALSLLLVISASVLFGGVIILFNEFLTELLNNKAIGDYLYLVPVILLACGTYLV